MIYHADEKYVFIRPEDALGTLDVEKLIHIIDSICWFIAINEYAHFEEMYDFFESFFPESEQKKEVLLKIKNLYCNSFQHDRYGYGYANYVFLYDTIGIGGDFV